MRILLTAITAAAALVTAGFVAAAGQEGAPAEEMVLTNGGPYGGGYRFTVTGRPITGLYPGATRQITVTVVSPYRFPLVLHEVSGRLVSTSRRGCPATSASLRITPYRGRMPFTVAPAARTTLPGSLTVTMPRTATPKCANSRFTIALTGTGRRADR